MDDPNLAILIPVVEALDELCESLVFVGGSITGQLVTEQRAQSMRPTKDVDVVVHVVSVSEYYAMERAVAQRGFVHDRSPEAPICRWVWKGVLLDLMPSQPGILGFHNRWYPLVVETAEEFILPNGAVIRLITAPLFIATKLEAFHGRGKADFLASHDLEDLLTIIDGRPELAGEILASTEELQSYIASNMKQLLENKNLLVALPGHLPGDSASQARLPELVRRMRLIAELDVTTSEM